MFKPRKIESEVDWLDADGVKIYTISSSGSSVNQKPFTERLKIVKATKNVIWQETPSFVMFHEGASCLYLVLAWWGNDNELFTSVSVLTENGWVEDPEKYSFCLFDLEVIWGERNTYIESIYCDSTDIKAYRSNRSVNV